MKHIRSNALSRQFHLVKAGTKAGWRWSKSQFETAWIVDDDKRNIARLTTTKKQAQQWVQEIGQLKGGIVKAGQILATYADYCLPQSIAMALHSLEAETEPLCWSVISPVFENALQEKRAELIIEPNALAAASLSQVHRARIKTTHQTICLKVLYPAIEKTLESDFTLLKKSILLMFVGEKKKNISQQLDGIIAILLDEVDIETESNTIKKWKKFLNYDTRYTVPVVYEDYSTKNILAMSFEQGVSQNDASVLGLSQERRNHLAANMLELLLSEIFLWGEMQTDPHAGNYRIRIANRSEEHDVIVLLDFGSVRVIDASLLKALRRMLLAAYYDDGDQLYSAVIEAGFLSIDSPDDIKSAFCSVLMGMIEPLNYKRRIEQGVAMPSCAVDAEGNYCWASAKLPERMGKLALKSALNKHFVFPGVDFMLVARKLAGVYAFISTLDAKFDGGVVMEKIISAQSSSALVSKSAHTGK